MTVHFDGMGPTWSILVREGASTFANVTHGIVADADQYPTSRTISTFDKRELDRDAATVVYSIYNPVHNVHRKMDWCYRNIPGVRVLRRTHQSIDVPLLDPTTGIVKIAEASTLHLEEGEGYQDRMLGAASKARTVSYTHLTLPTNREV